MALTWALTVERVTRIELALSAWEADVLPLNYTRGPRRPVRPRCLRHDIVPEPVGCERAALRSRYPSRGRVWPGPARPVLARTYPAPHYRRTAGQGLPGLSETSLPPLRHS